MTFATKILLLCVCASIVLLCTQATAAEDPPKTARPAYPKTRVEVVTDTLHGVELADSYRWLETADSDEVSAWIKLQNDFTRSTLDALSVRESIHRRLSELLAIGTISTPAVRQDRYFYSKRSGRQNQPVLYVRDGLDGKDRPLVDPNTLRQDGTVALDWYYPSRDGKRLAYGVSESGSEQSTLRVIDVDSGEHLPDTIPYTRACSLAWKPDGSGFYYTRYPTPGSVPKGEENYHRRVFYHKLGNDPKDDAELFGKGRSPQDWPNLDLSPDGRWLVVSVSQGWAKTEVYLRNVSKSDSQFVAVVEGEDAVFSTDMQNDRLYLQTNLDAPRYRVFAVDPAKPGRANWSELVPEQEAVLENIAVLSGKLFCHYLRDATSRLELYSLDGKRQREIELPTLGSLSGLGGEWDGEEVFFGFTSFAVPPTVYRIDMSDKRAAGKSGEAASDVSLWQRVEAPIDAAQYEIRQVRYTSKDGTKVPMFIVHRKGLELDGHRPTVLYGYGGFNVNQTPSFSRSLPLWLEHGGVYAVANLRGGGEYGEDWHRAGMLGKKQNVFDDFVAAGEWLVENKYTNPHRLAIYGGSNGGLLVGAALTQRPDLFRAVVCAVPLLDMIRYHHFRIAKLWIPEYGSADDAEQFRWLHAYSPYHRVQDGVDYPAVLFTTAESDSRVDPMHALKMAARLQAASSSDRPILLRVESRAGHGAGKPLSKTIAEQTDIWTFFFWQLGVTAGGV